MRLKQFLLFTLSFWLLASLILFAQRYSIAKHHINVAYVRHLYIFIVGVLTCSAMLSLFSSIIFTKSTHKLVLTIIVCAVAALLMALLLNPILYLMVGYKTEDLHFRIVSTGTLYFFLFYGLWASLYFHFAALSQRSASGGGLEALSDETAPKHCVFNVEKLGEKRLLQDFDICCVRASGDYVELCTVGNTYLVKRTLMDIQAKLDEARFKRVHRSSLVNAEKVEKIVAKSGGAYEIHLDGGLTVLSSRSFKVVVEAIVPAA